MNHDSGRIEVICGSMFCGKTEELLRRIRRATIAKQNIQVFKPMLDDRYAGVNKVSAHNGQQYDCIPLACSSDVWSYLLPKTTVIAFDEVQFFDDGIVNVIISLAELGYRVMVAGLETNFRGEPFGPMPKIMCCGVEEITLLHAVCVVCGEQATHTQRLKDSVPANYNDSEIQVGASESYEARCRKHRIVPGHPVEEITTKEFVPAG